MWAVSPELRAALDGNHEMTTEVFVVRGPTAQQIDPIGLSCQASLGTRGARSGGLVVDRQIVDDGWLDPLRDHVLMRTGVRGVGTIPLWLGRVDSAPDDDIGSSDINLISRADELTRAAFESPFPARVGALATAEMGRVIRHVNDTWAMQVDGAVSDAPVPSAVWEDNPGQALDDLAAGINAMWMPNRIGGIDVRPNPYSLAAAPTPVMTITDGVDGVIVSAGRVRSREQLYNSITVVVERTDGFAPLRITVRDDNPASRTYWGGEFGKQNKVLSVSLPLSAADARKVAERRLSQSLALAQTWSITLPPGPAQLLDPGDVIAVWLRGEVTAQVVESIRYADSNTSTVAIETREFRTFTSLPNET